MRRTVCMCALLGVLWLFAGAACQAASEAVASSVEALVQDGVRLHDKGDYAGAIAKYQAALLIEPQYDLALYELAYTYFAMGKYAECATTAESGLTTVDERLGGSMYALQATCLDEMGEKGQAVAVFRAGVAKYPQNAGLNLNFAVTLFSQGQVEESIHYLKQTILAQPLYPTPYYYLGAIFQGQGKRIPSLFFFLRFAMLEQNTARSDSAAQYINQLLNAGISDAGTQGLNLSIRSAKSDPEGDYTVLETALSLAAVQMKITGGAKSQAERYAGILVKLLQITADMHKQLPADTFTMQWAIDEVLQLHAMGGSEAFAYLLASRAKLAGANDWLQAHRKDLEKALESISTLTAEFAREQGN